MIIELVQRSGTRVLRLSDLDNLMQRPENYAGTDSQ